MEIIIHFNSKKIDSDYKKAIDEYTKRCTFFSKIKIKTYKKNTLPNIAPGSKVFVVNSSKDTISSTELAELVNTTCVAGFSRIEFIIPKDLDIENFSANNCEIIEFSSFTMSNELTAVALTEQIYRAFTILNNITYHK